MSQTDLGRFGEAADRPDDEAAAIAGGRGESDAEPVVVERDASAGGEDEVTVAIHQVNYTIEGRGTNEEPLIHLFGRNKAGDPEHVVVRGFRPYFYVPTADLTASDLEMDEITDSEDGYVSIRGDSMTRIYARTPRDVGQIRERFDHYEADVLFPNRFLIDKGIESGVRVPERRRNGSITVDHTEVEAVEAYADHRVHMVDIEVDDRSGFPEDGEEPIVCLTSHDSERNEYVVWLHLAPEGYGHAPTSLDDHELLDPDASVEVRQFDDEAGMLADYLGYVEETSPSIISGWNVDDFDAPYLLDRLERLDPLTDADLSIERLSPVNEVWRDNWQGPNVKGRVIFDLLYGYRRTQFTELDSYRLDAVGEVELGEKKEVYTGSIGDLWEENPERLLEYNLRDVELCVEIDRKQGVIAFWDEVRTFVGCKLEDAPTPGDTVDVYVLHKVHGEFVLPSKGQVEGEDYEGGAVFDPITGVREMVSVLDLASLYPMCMVTVNASPETKVDPETHDGETYLAPNGTYFRKEPDGIIREMVDELLAEREEKKGERDSHDPSDPEYDRFDRQQAAVKVIMNSLYGTLGWERFRLYDREMGAAVTATGREVLQHTQKSANEAGYEVVYGDSVTGDRPIVVRDPTGRVRLMPIRQLFAMAEMITPISPQILADGGHRPKMKEGGRIPGWEALSLSDDLVPEWQPIKQVIRHRSDKKVVRLQHKFGESITTKDHSYVVREEGALVERRPQDVKSPLRIPSLPDLEPIETIDVYQVLRGYTREYLDGRGVGKDKAIRKIKRIHSDGEFVWFGHSHHNDLAKTVKVRRFIPVKSKAGRSLIRLLAAYVSEGSATTEETASSRFGASIAGSDPEWLSNLYDDYHHLFEGSEASIIEADTTGERSVTYETAEELKSTTYDDGTLKLQMMNELAAIFFRQFAGQRSRGKRIPSFVYQLSDTEQELFIDVLIEGDGSRLFPRYSDEYALDNFDFETTSRELAAGLSLLLTQRGQKHSLKYRDAKESYTIRTCYSYRRGRAPVLREMDHDGYVYDLSVEKNENFVDGVGGIVLHNTDSVMLEIGDGVSKEDAISRSLEIEDHINNSYDEFALETLNATTHRFQIEFEKLYRRFFQAGKKKRYAGHAIWKEGKDVDDVDIVGFEYQRSDIAPITKEVQLKVIELIVSGEELEADLEEAKSYLSDVIHDFLAGDVELDDIGIPGGIGKRLENYETDTAHVRGAKYANTVLGTNFARGSKPKRYYLKGVHPRFFREIEESEGLDPRRDSLYGEFKRNPDVICVEYAEELPDEFEVDYEKMLDKTLQGPISRILEALDLSWEEIKSGQEQTGLGTFV